MTCNCKSEIEAKYLVRAKEQLPDSKDHKVELTGFAFVVTDGEFDERGCMPVEIEHTITVKKTGLERTKKQKQKFIFVYCPFCGVPYKEDKTKVAEV